ncbi:hypothetical protein ACIXSW_06165 [Bacteroides fragilis]
MLKQKYFLTGIFILSAERQPIKLAWRKIVWLQKELHTNESNNIDIHSTSLERKLSLALHKRYPVIWAADNIQELVLDDKATVENVYDVLAEIEDKCVHLSKLINIEFNPSNVQKLEEEYGVQISEHWKNYALNVINNFAGEVLAFAMQASSVR